MKNLSQLVSEIHELPLILIYYTKIVSEANIQGLVRDWLFITGLLFIIH